MSGALRTLVTALLVGGLVASGGTPQKAVATPADPRPNVLVILTDDQPIATLAVMSKVRKWMVKGGRNFPTAHVTTPLCCPSRATIFSGRYAHNHGVETNHVPWRFDQRTGMQRYLHDGGYRTAIFGKYLNGWPLEKDPPHFDDWSIFTEAPSRWNVRGTVRSIPMYSTTYVQRRALGFLEQAESNDGRPWFLYLSPFAPHTPLPPANKYRLARVPRWKLSPSVREADRSDKPSWVQGDRANLNRVRRERARMLRTLMSVDDMVDRVIRRLGRLGEKRRTLILFLSDNGWLWGEHGLRQKRWPYTRSTQVPFMMRWPGRIPGGSVDRRFVTNADIAPTILDAAGIAPEHLFDGRSLFNSSWSRTRVHLELEWNSDRGPPGWASTRTPSVQYTEYYDESGDLLDREFYDLVEDPWQLVNLLGDGDPDNDPPSGVLARLSAQLWRDRRCAGTEGATACP